MFYNSNENELKGFGRTIGITFELIKSILCKILKLKQFNNWFN